MPPVLSDLVEALRSGAIQVVDLTQPLGPDTPVIGLPPIFASSPGVTIDQISRYDDNGPAWYWNTITLGEHTGTHFDAPVHWITGKDLPDNTCDTLPVGRFVGPACVIDVSEQVASDPDFLLTVEGLEKWEAANGRVPCWSLGPPSHGLEQAPGRGGVPERERGRSAHAGVRQGHVRATGP